MRNDRQATSWVVYRTAVTGQAGGRTAVCEQAEWDAMEAARPGGHALIRAGIGSEPEAEREARAAGYDPGRSKRW